MVAFTSAGKAETGSAAPDQASAVLGDCATQRNLDAQGRAQSVAIGASFRDLGIPVSRVLASPFCRTLETAALAFGHVQFWRLKEDWLRLSAKRFGHRYLFDCIVPGGVAVDISDSGRAELAQETERIEAEVRSLHAIYDEHAGLQDRFANAGIVKPELAARLGLTGLAGRASAQAWDARAQFPQAPYDQLAVNMATQRNGDVLARAEVRFAELYESLRLVRELLARLPAGELHSPLAAVHAVREGLGWVEGWRGGVVVALRIGADGRLDRVHPHDPSWQNWPLLEIGTLGNIVPDFPLINKSFNLSYSGTDL